LLLLLRDFSLLRQGELLRYESPAAGRDAKSGMLE
jgi:hypothetical protein